MRNLGGGGVDSIKKSAVSLTKPVAKDLLDFLRRNVSYDMAGLPNANPGSVSVPSQGVDGWGALFTSDKQMAYAKNLKEGWLTPDEMAGLDQWVKETSWVDVQLRRKPDVQERATFITEFQMAAAMALLGKGPGAKGISGSGQKMPSGLPDNLTGYANPKDIRFTQNSVKNSFSDGKALQSTIDDLKSGKISPADLPAIRVFEKDGLIYSLDNRRVLAASAAGVPIKIVPATEAEIAKEVGRKMNTPNKGSIICVRGFCE